MINQEHYLLMIRYLNTAVWGQSRTAYTAILSCVRRQRVQTFSRTV